MLSHSAEPLTLSHKAELDWDKTIDAMVEQYGRKLFLWASKKAIDEGLNSATVMEDLRTRCATKLKKGDDALLASQVRHGMKGVARETVRRSTAYQARREEMAD